MEQAEEPQLSVADVRRTLAALRRGWVEVCSDPRKRPLYLCESLGAGSDHAGLSVEAFALRFVLSHHTKRVVKAEGAQD